MPMTGSWPSKVMVMAVGTSAMIGPFGVGLRIGSNIAEHCSDMPIMRCRPKLVECDAYGTLVWGRIATRMGIEI
jgi:hypothetical protein